MNKVTLIGRLGSDPELKQLPSGSVANFSLATNESWKDKEGNKQEHTEWHRITAWGKQGELAAQYLGKGRQCAVEGKIKTRSYEKDGETKYATDIIASQIHFLSDGGGNKQASLDPAPNFDSNEEIPF